MSHTVTFCDISNFQQTSNVLKCYRQCCKLHDIIVYCFSITCQVKETTNLVEQFGMQMSTTSH